jgi:hypothetical protein
MDGAALDVAGRGVLNDDVDDEAKPAVAAGAAVIADDEGGRTAWTRWCWRLKAIHTAAKRGLVWSARAPRKLTAWFAKRFAERLARTVRRTNTLTSSYASGALGEPFTERTAAFPGGFPLWDYICIDYTRMG